jgi:hypothetical protein
VSIFHLPRLLASVRTVLSAFLVLFLDLFAMSANAQTNSMWNGGTGNWSNSSDWNPGAVPNNGGTTTYDVKIGAANSNVTMDVLNDTIDSLTLAAKNSLIINSGDGLRLVSGTSLNSGTINAVGVLTNDDGGVFTNAGMITSTSVNGTLVNTGTSVFTNSGTISNVGIINENFDFLTASFTNNGTIKTAANGSIDNLGEFSSFTNNGKITVVSTCNLINGGSFQNFGTIYNNGRLVNSPGSSGDGFFANAGTINNNAGGLLENGIVNIFENSGTINNAGMLFNDFELDSSNKINNSGTLTNQGAFSTSGILNNSGTINNESAFENFAPVAFIHNSGTLNNSGTINNTQFESGNPAAVIDNTGTLNNSGTINNTLGQSLTNEGMFTNTGMLFNDSTSTIGNSGKLTNAGTIINNGTFTNSGFVNITSTGLFTTSANYTQTAGKTFVNGTLTATGPAIVDIHAGILGGGGTINGNVLMAGRMMAGMPGTPLTFLINGNYEQTGTGIYDELISSNANGLLQVSGAAKLDPGSSLDVFLLGGFDPSNGTSFTILDYSSESGAFAIRDPLFNGGTQKWVISSYDGGDGDDIVLTAEANNVATTPEPGNTLLLGTVLLVAAWYAQKKRSEHAQ